MEEDSKLTAKAMAFINELDANIEGKKAYVVLCADEENKQGVLASGGEAYLIIQMLKKFMESSEFKKMMVEVSLGMLKKIFTDDEEEEDISEILNILKNKN